MLIAVLGIALLVGTASAAVVNYLSNTIVAETTVELPITLEGSVWTFSPMYGGDNHLLLITVTNRANAPVNGVTELHVQKWYAEGGYWYDFDGEGIYMAMSSDIEYAWNATYNPGSLGWKDWLKANPSWMDWVVSGDLVKYNVGNIAITTGDGRLGDLHNTGDPDGDRDTRPTGTPYGNGYILSWINGRLTVPIAEWKISEGHLQSPPTEIIPAGVTYHTAVWVVADAALAPGTYRFMATIIPPLP
jgi:hypothetical protein